MRVGASTTTYLTTGLVVVDAEVNNVKSCAVLSGTVSVTYTTPRYKYIRGRGGNRKGSTTIRFVLLTTANHKKTKTNTRKRSAKPP
jgi:hypothetical protein